MRLYNYIQPTATTMENRAATFVDLHGSQIHRVTDSNRLKQTAGEHIRNRKHFSLAGVAGHLTTLVGQSINILIAC